ncbi:conserved hypothetical protein [Capnocytophaga canimorsus]|uniref:Uncharacterized protein n=1 Tax=Capnocytophaga canimorsus TaxID=28188 RepID=A0A0B7HS38_9FLAO|nr:hypothetical protein [Capnocytophaga canimorsus]ATA78061.1 hypothetical protein CGC47_03975 [Capnocytophaga canimorsus]PJI84081.1 hypothetical protein CLV61_0697 [Capnocytophaga canimorsus]CEN40393.1 conserved hypothetical protein [Capnocytophaga canimorsus]STA71993.1 Uncharacterised protein [Capnocytophaga canimorsus]
MKDYIAQMLELQEEKNSLFFEFQELPINEQVEYLNTKLDLQQYNKLKTNFLLDVMNNYYIDNEVLMQVWKSWLGTSIMHECCTRIGLITFCYKNPELKSEMIAETFDFIEKNLIVQYSENKSYTDEIIVYHAALLLWDLGYKNALQSLIKKYQTICDDYFDEEEYQKIENITENEG